MASDSGNRGGFDGDFDDSDLESRSDQDRAEVEKSGGLPYRIQFAPDYVVWNEARRLVSDRNGRVEDLATCCSQDPIIVMELLKVANAMFFSGGRQSITSAKAAIVRLGSDVVLDTLTRLTERPDIEDAEVKHWVENHRSRCRRASIVARMISESVSKTLSDDCQSATLFLYFGEMVAAAHFGEVYVKLAEQLQRSALIYRLAQDHKYDVEKIGLNYLRRNGIPEGLLFAIDRDSSSKSRDRAIMKPVSFAAGEMIEAFDVNRWEKLAPGKTLPPKSFIRVLQINEQQYLKLYEKVAEYLYAYRTTEEQRNKLAMTARPDSLTVASAPISAPPQQHNELHNDINSILHNAHSSDEEDEFEEDENPNPFMHTHRPQAPGEKATTVAILEEAMHDPNDSFSLQNSKQKTHVIRQKAHMTSLKEPPKLVSQRGNAVVSNISEVLNSAQNSEQLLSDILARLVDGGPFEKSALIVVSKDKKTAIVVAACGPNIGSGQKLSIEDPLNPLAQCFSKVQSFGSKESGLSPFGSRSFALAPINADHDTPVALYADCGNDKSISFEARRVFRTVVDILNERLPQIPGGIPVELRS